MKVAYTYNDVIDESNVYEYVRRKLLPAIERLYQDVYYDSILKFGYPDSDEAVAEGAGLVDPNKLKERCDLFLSGILTRCYPGVLPSQIRFGTGITYYGPRPSTQEEYLKFCKTAINDDWFRPTMFVIGLEYCPLRNLKKFYRNVISNLSHTA